MRRERATTGAGLGIADRAREAAGRPHDRVLGHLRAHGPVTLDELAIATGVQAIARVVFDLEDAALVIRLGDLVAAARVYHRKGVPLAVVDGGRP